MNADERSEQQELLFLNCARLRFICVLCVAVGCSPLASGQTGLAAQAIRGRVLLPDSLSSAGGVVVTAFDDNGATVDRVLSSPSGLYFLRLPQPGRYRVRALRIGYSPTVLTDIVVLDSAIRELDLRMTRAPVLLATMEVRDRDCGLHGPDAQPLFQLLEQARAALAATQLSQENGRVIARVVRFDGTVDKDGRNWEVDSLHAKELIPERVFAMTPTDTLVQAGFVRRRADSTLVYDMPSIEALLSDQFIEGHCFQMEAPPRDHPQWIGIGFSPAESRDQVADITGTLWLTRESAELARLDFSYTNLRRQLVKACGVGQDRVAFCWLLGNAEGAGGSINFVRLATGEWLTNSWMVKTPPGEGPNGSTRGGSVAFGNTRGVVAGVVRVNNRFGVTLFTVASVRRDTADLYRHESTLTFITTNAIKRAGKHPATIDGSVTDLAGHPVAHAVIYTMNPARAAVTTADGLFRLGPLPADTMVIEVRCPGFETIRFRLPLHPDSTRHLDVAMTAKLSRPDP